MSKLPADLKYTKSHEWLRVESDGSVTVGITDHAQQALGDMVYVETPEPGRQLNSGDAFAVVESVKAASDVYTPVGGEVLGANETLADAPEKVNEDPYGTGWLVHLRPADAGEIDKLLDADAYAKVLEEEGD